METKVEVGLVERRETRTVSFFMLGLLNEGRKILSMTLKTKKGLSMLQLSLLGTASLSISLNFFHLLLPHLIVSTQLLSVLVRGLQIV